MEYSALFEPVEEGGFVVTFPDFEWGVTQGDSEQDAVEMAQDALRTMLAEQIRKGEPLPNPSHPRGKMYRTIALPALEGAKAQLYTAFRNSGLRKTELAQRLKIPKTTVDRLFDFKNHTRMDQLEAAFAALGKQMRVEVRDAA
jgi:antitoxin HicB